MEKKEWRFGRAHMLMLISWCMGWLGFDRFYNGQTGLGIVKLLTLGGLFVWWLIDAIYFTQLAGKEV